MTLSINTTDLEKIPPIHQIQDDRTQQPQTNHIKLSTNLTTLFVP